MKLTTKMLAALLLLSIRLNAAIALVNHTWAGAANSVTTSAISCTGANLLVIYVADGQNATTGTMSSSPANTWTSLTDAASSFQNGALWYSKNASVSGSMTFTYASSGGTGSPAIFVECFSSADTSAPFDQQNTGTANPGPTVQPGSITPGVNNELVVTGSTTGDPGASYTINGCYSSNITDQAPIVGGVHYGGALAYCVQTTATATNPTWSGAGSTAVVATIASFKASAGAAFTANPCVFVICPN